MKELLKKEISLVLHPTNWLFLALSALVLVPNYPYYVTFFYTGLGIFFLCLSGRENQGPRIYGRPARGKTGRRARENSRRSIVGSRADVAGRPVRRRVTERAQAKKSRGHGRQSFAFGAVSAHAGAV